MIDGHGDDSYKYTRPITANFSSNVYSRTDLTELKNHLCRFIQGKDGELSPLSSYPEPQPYTLEAALARKLKLEPDEVCVTNGATEAIYLMAQTFRGTRSAILQPTFREYADACLIHGHPTVSLYSLPAERERYRLPEDIRMLWLCNPNNPTGSVTDKAWMEELIRCNPQVCFVIDQSYEYFTLQPLFSAAEAAAFPNVLLLHSMTKCYAVPGLRLGAVTGSRELLSRIRACRMPWSVNALAVEAGHYLLQHPEEYRMDIQALLAERKRVTDALEALGGVEVLPTDTHYFLARLRQGTAAQLKEFLATRHGLLIRDASNFEGLDARYFRIAIQTEEENNLLIEGIHEWIQNS